LLSVPLSSLEIFALCLYITKIPIIKDSTNKYDPLSEKNVKIGNKKAADIEPNDIYLVKYTITINIANNIKVITGIKNKNTPKLVATPFPPLKDIKQE
jgi:hypothetical protein